MEKLVHVSMWKGGPTFCNLSGADFAGMQKSTKGGRPQFVPKNQKNQKTKQKGGIALRTAY